MQNFKDKLHGRVWGQIPEQVSRKAVAEVLGKISALVTGQVHEQVRMQVCTRIQDKIDE